MLCLQLLAQIQPIPTNTVQPCNFDQSLQLLHHFLISFLSHLINHSNYMLQQSASATKATCRWCLAKTMYIL